MREAIEFLADKEKKVMTASEEAMMSRVYGKR
jgi:hypothetical protein